MKDMILKYKSFILYVFFGGCTTVINIATYALFSRVFHAGTIGSNIAAWIFAVSAAYITNKIWVFESEVKDPQGLVREIISFIICRLATGAMDMAIMYVSVEVLHWNDLIMKVISNILVIMLNFVFSKLVIFRKRS